MWTEDKIDIVLYKIKNSKLLSGKPINNNKVKQIKSNLNSLDDDGNNALMYACVYSPEIVSDLIKHSQPNINEQNFEGQTSLMLACEHNIQVAADLLAQPDIDIDLKDRQDRSAWETLYKYNNDKMTELSGDFYEAQQKNEKSQNKNEKYKINSGSRLKI